MAPGTLYLPYPASPSNVPLGEGINRAVAGYLTAR